MKYVYNIMQVIKRYLKRVEFYSTILSIINFLKRNSFYCVFKV